MTSSLIEHGSLIRECSGHLRSKLRRVLRTLGLTVLRFGVYAPQKGNSNPYPWEPNSCKEVPTGILDIYLYVGREIIEGDASHNIPTSY